MSGAEFQLQVAENGDGSTPAEVTAKEVEFILALKSNDRAIDYNRWPQIKTSVT